MKAIDTIKANLSVGDLFSVACVVRAGVTVDDLYRLEDARVIELRPDGGREFLPDADRALCPPGPRDTVLAYGRVL